MPETLLKFLRHHLENPHILNKNLEKLVAMTNFDNDEGLRRFQYIWRMKGIDSLLKERGIKEGMTVHIGLMEFTWQE